MKRKILTILLILLVLSGIFTYLWLNINIIVNKKFLLLKNYRRYSQLFDTRACKEAYEFLTKSSKIANPYEKFKDDCDSKKDYTETDAIKEVVFINNSFAKINVKREIISGEDKAAVDYPLSWMLEDGIWKRDWPN